MGEITKLDAARRALAEATTLGHAKDIRDRVEALRKYYELTKNREMEIEAAEIKVRAERRAGQILLQLKAEGLLKPGRLLRGHHMSLREETVTLGDYEITKRESTRFQHYALLDDAIFERRVAEGKEAMRLAAARNLMSFIKSVARPAAPAATPPLPAGRYAAIYADPAWRYQTWSPAGMDRAPDNHYPTMATADICALPVAGIAADDCALFLWVYSPMLPDALKVIEYWGFAYQSIVFVWAKKNGNGVAPIAGGHWTRSQAEIVVLATRGRPVRLNADVRQLIEAPRRAHSQKPDETYARIERLVAGPYIELFARATRPNWDAWGDEVPPQ